MTGEKRDSRGKVVEKGRNLLPSRPERKSVNVWILEI